MKKSIFITLTALILSLLLAAPCAWAQGDVDATAQDEWYISRADILVDELSELCADSTYVNIFGRDDMIDLTLEWSGMISAEPVHVGRYSLPLDLMTLASIGISGDLSEPAQKYLERGLGSMMLSSGIASQGVDFLAASSVLRISEGYIMPEGFEPCLVLYEYEDICVGVVFEQIGNEVVTASAAVCTEDIKQFCASIGSAGGALTQDDSSGVSRPDRTPNTGSKRGK